MSLVIRFLFCYLFNTYQIFFNFSHAVAELSLGRFMTNRQTGIYTVFQRLWCFRFTVFPEWSAIHFTSWDRGLLLQVSRPVVCSIDGYVGLQFINLFVFKRNQPASVWFLFYFLQFFFQSEESFMSNFVSGCGSESVSCLNAQLYITQRSYLHEK